MIVYGASELGGCIKRQAAIRMGYEKIAPPAAMLEIFAQGNKYEDMIVDHLTERGFDLDVATPPKPCLSRMDRCEQHEVVFHVSNEIKVVGHIDGFENGLKRRLLEIKSMSGLEYDKVPRSHAVWDVPGLIQKYKWQISVYMNALGLPATVLFGCREPGREEDYFTVTLEEPFYSEVEIRARVLQIEAFYLQGVLPEACSSNDYPCPVYYLHTDTTEMGDEALMALALTYQDAADEEKRLKKIKDNLRKDLLKAAGGDNGVVEAKFKTENGDKVTFYKGAGRMSVDTDAMKEDGIYDKYLKQGSEWQGIRVTRNKGVDHVRDKAAE